MGLIISLAPRLEHNAGLATGDTSWRHRWPLHRSPSIYGSVKISGRWKDAVQQAFTAQTFQGAQAALVVTNSIFSTSARQASATTGVYLIHHAQLVDTADQILRRLTLSAS